MIFTFTHSFPMHHISTPWKHQETSWFSDVFREYSKGALAKSGLKSEYNPKVEDALVGSSVS